MQTMPPSTLTKSQKKTYGPKTYTKDGQLYKITAKVRHDDECGNGHNTFSITADIRAWSRGRWEDSSFGCCHEEVAKRFPELAPLIKWHLTSSDEPLHYIANTVYHARENGATRAWVYFTGQIDPLNLGETKERLLGYFDASEVGKLHGADGYRVDWDQKTVKLANLDHARSSAVWLDATDEQLRAGAESLTAALMARHPALMEEFRSAVQSLGFIY